MGQALHSIVLGSGYLLGEHFQIDPRNVHAYIIGEHGDSEVPVWSLANVAGIRLKDYCPICRIPYDQKQFDELFLKVKAAGYEIAKRKGRTNYAVALAITKIVESLLRNENAVLTVSTLLEDYHGVSDICLSVPVVLNRAGVKEIIKLPLDEKEILDFRNSASVIRKVNDSLGL